MYVQISTLHLMALSFITGLYDCEISTGQGDMLYIKVYVWKDELGSTLHQTAFRSLIDRFEFEPEMLYGEQQFMECGNYRAFMFKVKTERIKY